MKLVLSPGKRRNRKVELGGLEEEYLGRGKSREKAPTPERSRHHQKTAVPSALSRVLGEKREIRVWAKSRAQELPVSECFLGNTVLVTFVRHLPAQ